MKSSKAINWLLICVMCWATVGCKSVTMKEKKLSYLGDKDHLEHYKDEVTSIEYTEVAHCTPDEVKFTQEPRTIRDRKHDEIWDLSLTEALHLALKNNRVIRTDGSFMNSTEAITNQNASSVYDPAIQETGVLFGGRGVEAALSDFDANFTTSMLWGRNNEIVNSPFFGGTPGGNLTRETGAFRAGVSKQFATGGSFALRNDWDYSGTNASGQLFPSAYTGNVRGELRQPLWARSGTEYTRIAGPGGAGFSGVTGVSQGVSIARINNDITVADFELSVIDLLRDVETVYWQLYLDYHRYHTVVTARNSALESWRNAKLKLDIGGISGFKLVDEAQARDLLFQRRSDAATSLGDLYSREIRLRRLLGLSVNDGRVIRPVDEPVEAEFIPEWYGNLVEALTNRVEIRKQKWSIRSLELQHIAAQSLTNPQLDFVSSYQVNGFGDQLWGLGSDDDAANTNSGLRYGMERITQGDETGWTAGVELSMPIGFRSAKAQVRNYELRIAKSREQLAVLELEISHELAVAIQKVHSNYIAAREDFSRRKAARRRVELYEAEVDAGTSTLDPLLRAQSSLAEAEVAFYTSLVDYNLALLDLQYRKGTVLEYDNVYLSEGSWTPAAYRQAVRRAWARTYAIENPHLHSEPGEFAQSESYPRYIDVARPETRETEPSLKSKSSVEESEGPTEVPPAIEADSPQVKAPLENKTSQLPRANRLETELPDEFNLDFSNAFEEKPKFEQVQFLKEEPFAPTRRNSSEIPDFED
ncbi:Outer membrane efflux protein [Polystyrenella longa]|uniref:Outer membrane efflux protein n=1 Tax=Polystyrenella longa TaxID=2528007 RepID=A0A518CI37_9PLAN|nr:TolC family protein [Polystyrenella longa]QDU78892.1 Outer membrane efflux protein [Polystyrenella longa]